MLPEQRHLLETFAGQIGLALERAVLAEQAETARVAAEGESLRNTLLASISHDLRTPLAVMAGASSTLAEHGDALDASHPRAAGALDRNQGAGDVRTDLQCPGPDALRVRQIELRNDWQTLDELVESSLRRWSEPLAATPGGARPAARICRRCYVDASLIIQVFTNLLDNIVKYTPAGTHIHIAAVTPAATQVRVTVDDEGPGLPPGDPARLFDKFQRGHGRGHSRGGRTGTGDLPRHRPRPRRRDRGRRPAGWRRAFRVYAAHRRDPGSAP